MVSTLWITEDWPRSMVASVWAGREGEQMKRTRITTTSPLVNKLRISAATISLDGKKLVLVDSKLARHQLEACKLLRALWTCYQDAEGSDAWARAARWLRRDGRLRKKGTSR